MTGSRVWESLLFLFQRLTEEVGFSASFLLVSAVLIALVGSVSGLVLRLKNIAFACLFLSFCAIGIRWKSVSMVFVSTVVGFFWIYFGWNGVRDRFQKLLSKLYRKYFDASENDAKSFSGETGPIEQQDPVRAVNARVPQHSDGWLSRWANDIDQESIPEEIQSNINWLLAPYRRDSGRDDRVDAVGLEFLRWLQEVGGRADGYRIAREFFERVRSMDLRRDNFEQSREPLRRLGLIYIYHAPRGNMAVLTPKGQRHLHENIG